MRARKSQALLQLDHGGLDVLGCAAHPLARRPDHDVLEPLVDEALTDVAIAEQRPVPALSEDGEVQGVLLLHLALGLLDADVHILTSGLPDLD